MEENGTLIRPEDAGKGETGVVKRWLLELKLADKRESDWRKKSERVLKRYRQKEFKKYSFNILWSNTETMRPAIYNSLPKPDVRRRFKDEDPIGKIVSEVLSRALEFGMDTTNFDSQIRGCVLDMLLPGRGVARVRYVPSFNKVEPLESEETIEGEATEGDIEELAWEQAPIEHVEWSKFRMGAGSEWSCVPWVAFMHNMTRDELEEKFGEIGTIVPLEKVDDQDVENENDEDVKQLFKTATVWEIWDKEAREVLFIAPSYKDKPLMTVDDPLSLTDFFPNPKPLYAIEDSGDMVPIPLFEYYKEQADELDTVTRRISILVKGLKMRGIYDATLSELSELMRGEDNDLIPAANVTALIDRGGLEKAIWFMPIEQAARVLQILQIQRDATKQVIYEITGISDILRGSTNPNETLGAQQIKSQWGSARLKRMQTDAAMFIRDLIRLQAEVIGDKFQPETLAMMTGIKLPTGAEKEQVMMQWQAQAAQAQQAGQQPPPQPELQPSWDEIIQVMRDDRQRTFKVDVETDSTVAASVESDMAGLRDVLTALSQTIQGFGPAVQQGSFPVEALKEILMTITRRAKMGSAVEDAIDKIKQPKPQDPNAGQMQIEQMKMQSAQQAAQMQAQLQEKQAMSQMQHEAQIEQMKAHLADQQHQRQLAADMQAEQQKAQIAAQLKTHEQEVQAQQNAHQNQIEAEREQQRMAMEAAQAEREAQYKLQSEAQRIEFERWKAELAFQQAIRVAEISAETTIRSAQSNSANQPSKDQPIKDDSGIADLHKQTLFVIQGLTEQMNKPKTIIRGPDGKAIGVK